MHHVKRLEQLKKTRDAICLIKSTNTFPTHSCTPAVFPVYLVLISLFT
jgi:hypothetical protein